VKNERSKRLKNLSLILLVLAFSSCQQSENSSRIQELESTPPEDTLHIYQHILSELEVYQQEYPIPKISKTNYYHYQIIIEGSKMKFMRIAFLPIEYLELELKGMFYFKDSIPASLMDLKSKESSAFYNNDLFNDSLMSRFQLFDYEHRFDETFPPVWKYEFKNGGLVLVEKDTVWQHWNWK